MNKSRFLDGSTLKEEDQFLFMCIKEHSVLDIQSIKKTIECPHFDAYIIELNDGTLLLTYVNHNEELVIVFSMDTDGFISWEYPPSDLVRLTYVIKILSWFWDILNRHYPDNIARCGATLSAPSAEDIAAVTKAIQEELKHNGRIRSFVQAAAYDMTIENLGAIPSQDKRDRLKQGALMLMDQSMPMEQAKKKQ